MIRTSRQLKDWIRNLSKEIGIESHVLIRKYMMERFLERVSRSQYKDYFILKGGMLIASFLGAEARATMDMDTTIKGIPVTIEDMEHTITEILDVDIEDHVIFRIKKVSEIMDEAEYPGIRFSMDALLDGSVTPLKIDISTGDVITPREISYSYRLMFEDRSIPIMTYPMETVLAEKLETFISRSTTNTRMRDLYDIHLLLESQKIDYDTLALALERTAKKRGSFELLANAENVLKAVELSDNMRRMWDVYRKSYHYASEYTWEEVLYSVRQLSIKAKLNVEKPSVLRRMKQLQEHKVGTDVKSTKVRKEHER